MSFPFVKCWLIFLLSHYLIAFLVDTKSYPVWYVQQRPGLVQVVHTWSIVPAWLDGRVWCTKFHPHCWIFYFRLSGFQASRLLIHFRCGPNTCSYCSKVWYITYSPICDAPLSRNRAKITILVYKITKIVRALWLAEKRVCMLVCKHGCDIKMFCFSRANHASANLKKVLSWKTRQVYFI